MDLKQHISINEIAEVNGVSLSTVYRVMRGAGKTRNPKHLRVRSMLANAGYLSENERTYSPLLLVAQPGLTTHSHAMISHLQKICEQSGIELIFSILSTYKQELRRRLIAGIISLTEIDELPPEIPCVYLNLRDLENRHSAVCVDLFQNAIKVFKYLRGKGYRRIGYLSDHLNLSFYKYLKHGVTSARAIYEFSGCEYSDELVFAENMKTETHHIFCQHAAAYFAALRPMPDAVVLYGDIYNKGFSHEMANLGIRIPGDLCLAAVDDSGKWPMPAGRADEFEINIRNEFADTAPIISARAPLPEMVEAAVNVLKEHIMNPGMCPRQIIIGASIDDPFLKSKK